MTKILTSIFLGTLITIGSAAIAAGTAADPVVGTWKLNVAKSTFKGRPGVENARRGFTRSPNRASH